ncbi:MULTISPECIES: ParA family protein [Alkalispirochaeta]|nr:MULTISPECIES: ParA family protein [Alkalispirochaeta]
MGTVITFANQKGGVGKTTTAVNLGAAISAMGKKVLLIDFDSQGNLSSSVGADRSRPGIYQVISGSSSPAEAVQETPQAGLFIIAGGGELTGASVELVNQERREFFLRDALEPLRQDYDYIFVDSPPSLGLLTLNALVAAQNVIIPLQCEYFALEGLTQLLQNIKRVQGGFNQELELFGILFTMYDSRTRLANDVVQEVIGYFGKRVFRTIIPRNIRLSEAPSHGIPVNLYDPACVGSRSYQKLAEEVEQRVNAATTR